MTRPNRFPPATDVYQASQAVMKRFRGYFLHFSSIQQTFFEQVLDREIVMTAQSTNSRARISTFICAKETVLLKTRLTLGAVVLASTLSFAALAVAQNDTRWQLYESSATLPTNIEGIRTFPAPPEGFEPLHASDEELASYGIPPRPDSVSDPDGYRRWARLAPLMGDPHARWYGELKPRTGRGNLAHVSLIQDAEQQTTFSSTRATGNHWSGVVNTLPLTKWSTTNSFRKAEGDFVVPRPQEAFAGTGGNICDGDHDQASLWVGLGGLTVTGWDLGNQNNILQSGVDIEANCSGLEAVYAWVEWYPASVARLFDVSPGDDIDAEVVNTSATGGYFSILDKTKQIVASYHVAASSGHQLVGNEAEYILERPSGDSKTPSELYPLANYVWSFWADARSEDFTGAYHYPSDSNSATIRLSMTDDSGATIISKPELVSGEQIFLEDENCALSGGCKP